jgi:hypothetical protein
MTSSERMQTDWFIKMSELALHEEKMPTMENK